MKRTQKFLFVILRTSKHTFCTIPTPKKLRFIATSPFAAHPNQNIRAFVTEQPALKQVLHETLKQLCEKSSVPVLPNETLIDLETETSLSLVEVVLFENIRAYENSVFSPSRSGRVINPPACLDNYVLSTEDSDEDLSLT